MQVKGPTEVNFKYGGGQTNFSLANLFCIPHFQNDGTTVECSTLVLLRRQLAILSF